MSGQYLAVHFFGVRAMRSSLVVFVSLFGCGEEEKSPESTSSDPTVDWAEPVDRDEDGAFSDVDCDDSDASINPSATELCDGVDNDCDGETDESGAEGETDWYLDADEDGEGTASDMVTSCDCLLYTSPSPRD